MNGGGFTIAAPADDAEARLWRSADQRDRVLAALDRLPATQRAALLLAYADGLSVREIGRTLGRSEKAVESILTRGRAGFRSAYGEDIDG